MKGKRRQPTKAAGAQAALAEGLGHYGAGRLAEAETVFRRIVAAVPGHADAWYLLGLSAHRSGRSAEAVGLIEKAIAANGGFAPFHYSLGQVFRALGRQDEAAGAYGRAIALDPAHAEAHNNLGTILQRQGRLDEAADAYGRAVAAKPDYAKAHSNRGVALLDLGRAEEAAEACRRAVALAPDDADAANNLANALLALKRFEEAAEAYGRAVALRPDHAAALSNLGVALLELARAGDAAEACRRAAALVPDNADAFYNLGCALRAMGHMEDAAQSYRRAIAIKPDHAEAHNNLGNLFNEQGRRAEAADCYRRSLAARPDYADAHFNLGMALLRQGRFDEGWREYEWRWKVAAAAGSPPRHRSIPAWTGEPGGGRTLLLWGEQGYGDSIQFARYATVLARDGWRVVLEVPPPLVRLMQSLEGVAVVAEGRPLPPVHAQCPLLGLPLRRGTLFDIPVPYLRAEPERVAAWAERLPKDGLRVGLVWQGNPRHNNDHNRSFPLAGLLARLEGVAGLRLVSLQRDHGLEQLTPAVRTLGPEFDGGDFAETAAVLANLDLIITSDTAVAHLAGALGRPVWVALSIVVDWRWMEAREDSPWYPSVRLFRQGALGDWDGVFARMAEAMRDPAPAPDAQSLLAEGLRLQQDGRMAEAETAYRRLLKARPDNADAWHLLGLIAHKTGRSAEAVGMIETAIATVGTFAPLHYNLAQILKSLGRLDAAEASFRRAIALDPAYADAQCGLGVTLKGLGRMEDAAASYRQAIASDPGHAEAHNNLGNVLKDQGRLDEAMAAYRRALELRPGYAEALSNLGTALQARGRVAEAADAYRRATALKPDYARAYANLGAALVELGRMQEALEVCRHAVTLDPRDADAANNLGNALRGQGRLDEAIEIYHRALALRPDHAETWSNLGVALRESGRTVEAIAAYADHALVFRPDYADAHYNLGMALLHAGRFEEGWREYEWRWQVKGFPGGPPRHRSIPAWTGEPGDGRTLLLWCEQGYGDSIQFLRLAPLAAVRGWRVVVEIQPALVRLARGLDGVTVIARGEPPPPAEAQCPLLSLPCWLGNGFDVPVPYLRAEPERAAAWAERLPKDGLRVGLVWQGNPRHNNDRNRSFPLAGLLAHLSPIPGLRLISLQRDHGLEQLTPAVRTLGPEFDGGDFAETAAVLAHLDLIITPDTAVAHLAGALGRPVWVALPTVVDWRWTEEREDSPWYPSVRLFRQAAPGHWDGVFARMAARLAPDSPDAQYNLGNALWRARHPGEAEGAYRAAIALRPDFAAAHGNLGIVLRELGRLDDAIAAYRHAGTLRPEDTDILYNLGMALRESGRLDEAIDAYGRAVALSPSFADAHRNLGVALREAGRLEAAAEASRRAVALRPDFADAHSNLSAMLRELGQVDEAVASARSALALRPDHAEAHFNLGMALLHRGDFAEGWREHEWRWRMALPADKAPRHPSIPPWRGEAGEGRTLLLWAEQGLGDSIQFARYAALLASRGWRVILEVPPPLDRLMRSLGGVTVTTGDTPLPPVDAQCPLLGVPRWLEDTFATPVPYLRADPERAAAWAERLPKDGLRVGVIWQGNPRHRNDRHRSFPLAGLLAHLSPIAGLRLISLQRDHGLEQLIPAVRTLGPEFDGGDFAETAAVLAHLDLIITPDTAVAHLAGALGRPAWVALSIVVDWRWMEAREDSPWYPSVRLFRQGALGDWDGVFARMAAALAETPPRRDCSAP